MFSYFGGKSKLINYYPPPKYDMILEPFAGGARYACKYGLDRNVWINDKYQVIYKIWKWIQQASHRDINRLPVLARGEDLRNVKSLSEPERMLLGFAVNRGVGIPKNVVTEWASTGRGEITRLKSRLRPLIGKIDHWKITCLDFKKVRTPKPATYFVDPPYQHRRTDYVVQSDSTLYPRLKAYCRLRRGQVIVCESTEADWWNFKPLKESLGQRCIMSEGIKVIYPGKNRNI